MKLSFGSLEPAIFVKRDNRFRAEIEIEGKRYKAHVANSGRMAELLVTGAAAWVRKSSDPARKTPYDLVLIEHAGESICLNAHFANDILAFWLQERLLEDFAAVTSFRREKVHGDSRFDFELHFGEETCLLEVKSVNLVVDGEARFPDAPTVRGTKHVRELTRYQQEGGQSAIVFIVMRQDAERFAPNSATDPEFAQALEEAAAAGVFIRVYRCGIDTEGVSFAGRIEAVQLAPEVKER